MPAEGVCLLDGGDGSYLLAWVCGKTIVQRGRERTRERCWFLGVVAVTMTVGLFEGSVMADGLGRGSRRRGFPR